MRAGTLPDLDVTAPVEASPLALSSRKTESSATWPLKCAQIPSLNLGVQLAEQPNVKGNQRTDLQPGGGHLRGMAGYIENLHEPMLEHQRQPTDHHIEQLSDDQNDHIGEDDQEAYAENQSQLSRAESEQGGTVTAPNRDAIEIPVKQLLLPSLVIHDGPGARVMIRGSPDNVPRIWCSTTE